MCPSTFCLAGQAKSRWSQGPFFTIGNSHPKLNNALIALSRSTRGRPGTKNAIPRKSKHISRIFKTMSYPPEGVSHSEVHQDPCTCLVGGTRILVPPPGSLYLVQESLYLPRRWYKDYCAWYKDTCTSTTILVPGTRILVPAS